MDAVVQPRINGYESALVSKIENIKEIGKPEAPPSPLLEIYDEEKAAKYFQDAVYAWRQGSGAVRIIDESPKPSPPTSNHDFFTSFPFFYGWIVLLITTIARVFKAYGQMNTLFMYIPAVLKEFDFSRAFFSSMFGFACIVGAFLQPIFGGPIDRLGARMCMPMSLFGVSAALFLFSVSSNFVMIFFALVGLRTICIGVMENVLNQCLSQWFSRLRGRAFSINQFMTLFIVCTMIDQILNFLNDRYGWRVTMQIAACSASLYTIPIMLFVRKTPESVGLHPDGDSAQAAFERIPAEGETKEGGLGDSYTRQQAMRTISFWTLTAFSFLNIFCGAGCDFYMIEMIGEYNKAIDVPTVIFGAGFGIAGSLTGLICGMAVDRGVPSRMLLATSAFFMATWLGLAPMVRSAAWVIWPATIARGLAEGISTTVQCTVIPEYYGRAHVGAISSVIRVMTVAGSGIGPFFFGVMRDVMGEYTTSLHITCAANLLLTVALLNMRVPGKLHGSERENILYDTLQNEEPDELEMLHRMGDKSPR